MFLAHSLLINPVFYFYLDSKELFLAIKRDDIFLVRKIIKDNPYTIHAFDRVLILILDWKISFTLVSKI